MRLAAAKAEETIRIVLEGEHRRSVPARVRGTFLPWRGARLHRPGRAELCAAAQAGPRACDRRAGDALLLSELPKRIPPEEPVDMVTAEGTHDARAVAPRARAAKPPPSLRSAAGTDTGRKPRLARRRETRRIYRRLGRTIWKRCSGYHQRCRLAAAVTQMTRASALTAGAERVGMAEFHPAFGDHDATATFDPTCIPQLSRTDQGLRSCERMAYHARWPMLQERQPRPDQPGRPAYASIHAGAPATRRNSEIGQGNKKPRSD